MLESLTTESRNPASERLDSLSPLELVKLMNSEDAKVAAAVALESDAIATGVQVISDRLRQGGRLIYFGAGSSGRLGVLDAAECPPTFNSEPWQVVGIIAGGPAAMTRAVENAEDSPALGIQDLIDLNVGPMDVVVGIATSGRTPYVIGGLEYAGTVGAYTIAISCNEQSEVGSKADLAITPIVGPEIVSGSTRLKAGTATKLVLNSLSTGAMVLLGKTFGNLMVDLKPTNVKLTARARRIVSEATGMTSEDAFRQLEVCEMEVKTAIVAWQANTSPERARELLLASEGRICKAVKLQESEDASGSNGHVSRDEPSVTKRSPDK
ncbi:MAG: N-acetylmuramic acid 6-phosphate etherase [Planctomycetota bacterium]